MSNVANEIVNYLRLAAEPKTDRQIAEAIGRPVASVRRTRLYELEPEGVIDFVGDRPLRWSAAL